MNTNLWNTLSIQMYEVYQFLFFSSSKMHIEQKSLGTTALELTRSIYIYFLVKGEMGEVWADKNRPKRVEE